MVDITVTPGSVTPVAGASKESGIAGETITAGQPVCKDPTTKKFLKADSNSATSALRAPVGIALNNASLDQPMVIQTAGDINIGATVVVGTVYALSETPGGIQPVADLATGEYVTVIGVGITSSRLRLGFIVSGVAVP